VPFTGLLFAAGPVSATSIVVRAPVGVVTGTDQHNCFRVHLPLRHAVDIAAVEIRRHGLSHHVQVFTPTVAHPDYPVFQDAIGEGPIDPDTALTSPPRCNQPVDGRQFQLLLESQQGNVYLPLPPGVTFRLRPGQDVLVQTHFNGPSTRAWARVIFHRARRPSAVHAGGFFGFYRGLDVPAAAAPGAPGRMSTASTRCRLSGPPAAGRTLHILYLTGHYHYRGVKFEAFRVDAAGVRRERVYLDFGYRDSQLFALYDGRPGAQGFPLADASDCPRLPAVVGDRPDFSACPRGVAAHMVPLVLGPGEGLEWQCTWINDSCNRQYDAQTPVGCVDYTTGPSTAANEHCNLFAAYYPALGDQEAITCVRNDGFTGTRPDPSVPVGSMTRCVSGRQCGTTGPGDW
jgi:hypothetical protein